MILFFLFLTISCAKIDILGPTLNQRTEAVNQAINNLNIDKTKASAMIRAYMNNIKPEDIRRVEDFIFEMENNGPIEDKLFLFIDCYEYYEFDGQKYFLNFEEKEDIRSFLKNKVVLKRNGFIEVSTTLKRLKDDANSLNNISKNFNKKMNFIEETLKFYNQFFYASSKIEKIEVVSDIIFSNSIKTLILIELEQNKVSFKDLNDLYKETSAILSLSKSRRLV